MIFHKDLLAPGSIPEDGSSRKMTLLPSKMEIATQSLRLLPPLRFSEYLFLFFVKSRKKKSVLGETEEVGTVPGLDEKSVWLPTGESKIQGKVNPWTDGRGLGQFGNRSGEVKD